MNPTPPTRCLVSFTGTETIKPNREIVTARRFRVVNQVSAHVYVVRIWEEGGKRYGICLCRAGSVNRKCRHAVAASLLDNAVKQMGGH
jgi:hypothetical protein